MNAPVAYLGPDWTYSYLAVQKFQRQPEFQLACSTIDEVFAAILTDKAFCGLVPIFNSASGLVSDTAESILRRLLGIDAIADQVWWKRPLCISGCLPLPVQHCLVGFGQLPKIERVVSKHQAVQQCSRWLQQHLPAAQIETSDSSTASLPFLEQDPSLAAISSLEAAQAAGVPILAKNIQDQHDNLTEFVVVQRDDLFGYIPYPNQSAGYSEYWVRELQGALATTPALDQSQLRDERFRSWVGTLTFAGRQFEFCKQPSDEVFHQGQPVTAEVFSPGTRKAHAAAERWRLGVA